MKNDITIEDISIIAETVGKLKEIPLIQGLIEFGAKANEMKESVIKTRENIVNEWEGTANIINNIDDISDVAREVFEDLDNFKAIDCILEVRAGNQLIADSIRFDSEAAINKLKAINLNDTEIQGFGRTNGSSGLTKRGKHFNKRIDNKVKELTDNVKTSKNKAIETLNEGKKAKLSGGKLLVNGGFKAARKSALRGLGRGALSGVVKGVFGPIADIIGAIKNLPKIIKAVVQGTTKVFKAVKSLGFKGLKTFIKGGFKAALKSFQAVLAPTIWLSVALFALETAISIWIENRIKNFINNISNSINNNAPIPNIPANHNGNNNFAQGGFPTPGRTFIAREAGPELVGTLNGKNAVINNNQIVEAVSNGVYGAFMSAIGNENSGTPAIARVYLDSKQIAMARAV